MNQQSASQKTVLLPEGSSLTARETLTALAQSGIAVNILSSSGFAVTTFSKWKRRIIRAANVNHEPEVYLYTLSKLLRSGEYAALIPTHEQAWLFAEERDCLPQSRLIPVADKEAFARVQGKIAFAELADEIGLPQPRWQRMVPGKARKIPFPCWLKADYGTAGRSVCRVNSQAEVEAGTAALSTGSGGLMLQEHTVGRYGQVQAVFDRGRLIAVHTSLQAGAGVGGSAAARVSVKMPQTVEHVRRLGAYIHWHGGLTLDFIEQEGTPRYLECNARMVEPGNAAQAGVNFPELLLGLVSGESPKKLLIGRPGVKTHSTMGLLLGTAEKTKSRKAVWRLFLQSLRGKGIFEDSTEVLTPWKRDPRSIIPLLTVLLRLLIRPEKAAELTALAVENYCVLPETIRNIRKRTNAAGQAAEKQPKKESGSGQGLHQV